MTGMVTEPEGQIHNNQLMIASIHNRRDQGTQMALKRDVNED
jgi:hypothetical protein